ncbi:MAG: DUF2339 domain-containing protein [Rhizobacter sp.]|nr:DUF2339 domain-containing protein [Rhizobacter sp.]
MVIIAIIVGAVLGMAVNDGFAPLAGALLAWLVVRTIRQQRRIDDLWEALNRGHAAQVGAVPPAAGRPVARPPTGPTGDMGGLARPAAAGSAPPLKGPLVATPAARIAVPVEPPGDTLWDQPARASSNVADSNQGTQRDLLAGVKGWIFGGNTIVKVGVGILFIGLAFLAKYATEHVDVPIEVRLAGIGGVALALLAVGWRLRLSRAGYAQVLQGGAVAVLYLTLFVAFRFYGVLAAGPVFAMMVVVAALAAALAVLQDARALALVGALGGFATPLLISTGAGNHVALFGYYLVLNLGIAAVAWFKDWRALNLVGFFATFLVGTAWGVLKYQSSHYASSQAFLVANFLLFNAILLMPARRAAGGASGAGPGRAAAWVNGTLLFGLPTICFVLQHALVRHTEYGTALSALSLAAFYVVMAGLMRSRRILAVTFEASLAISVIFLTLVIPFALDARSTAGAWAIEGAGLVWLGFRQRRGLQRAFGYALLLLAGGAMVWAHRIGVPTSVFNAFLFNSLMAAAASLAAAFFVHRALRPAGAASSAVNSPGAPADAAVDVIAEEAHRAAPTFSPGGLEPLAEPLLIAWGLVWMVVASAVQIDAFVSARDSLAAWLACFSAMALLCTALSVRLDWARVASPALAHVLTLALVAAFSALLLLDPASHGGAWAWPLALGTHLIVLRWAAPRWPARAIEPVHAVGALVLALLVALQGRAVTADWGESASAWAWLGWLVGPALLLLMLVQPALARRWPVSAAPPAYQTAAAALLAAGLLLWTLLANIDSTGSARPLPYLPLLNPLDIGIGVALAAAWFWWRSDAAAGIVAHRPRLGVAVLGMCGFVWLNAMLIRAFHHHGGVPFRFDAWADSLAVQTGLTLLWSVTALVLMWLSARRTMRAPWLVGAVLLGAVVLKLLLVDLSGTGTVTRIVSFIGVGVLMLVIGYVAPLPTKGERHVAS